LRQKFATTRPDGLNRVNIRMCRQAVNKQKKKQKSLTVR
jgi:hypothetical protein